MGLTASIMFPFDIDSTPPPIPIPISPEAIAFAIVATAYSPDEQSLLIPWTVVVSGYPARNPAILELVEPAPL